MKNLGCGDEFLDVNACFARIGLGNMVPVYEPLLKANRNKKHPPIPFTDVFPLGTKVKFLRSLKHHVMGRGQNLSQKTMFSMLSRNLSEEQQEQLAQMCFLEGEVRGTKPFSEFPFDEFMTVVQHDSSQSLLELALQDQTGTAWIIGPPAFTSVTQIEVIPVTEAVSSRKSATTAELPKINLAVVGRKLKIFVGALVFVASAIEIFLVCMGFINWTYWLWWLFCMPFFGGLVWVAKRLWPE